MPEPAPAPREAALAETARALARIARARPGRRRARWPIGLAAFGLTVFLLALLLIPAIGAFVAYAPGVPLDPWAVVRESAARAPFLISAGVAVLGATIYADWRDRRELGFRLADELHGPAMMTARRLLAAQMRAADGTRNLDDPRQYFPTGVEVLGPGPEDAAAFEAGHALHRIATFAYRVRTYDAERMLDHATAVALLRMPFAHFEIVLLELAAALRAERRRLNADGYAFDARWDAMADGIEGFFRLLGLAGRLPEGHRFWYFPSAGRPAPAAGRTT